MACFNQYFNLSSIIAKIRVSFPINFNVQSFLGAGIQGTENKVVQLYIFLHSGTSSFRTVGYFSSFSNLFLGTVA